MISNSYDMFNLDHFEAFPSIHEGNNFPLPEAKLMGKEMPFDGGGLGWGWTLRHAQGRLVVSLSNLPPPLNPLPPGAGKFFEKFENIRDKFSDSV